MAFIQMFSVTAVTHRPLFSDGGFGTIIIFKSKYILAFSDFLIGIYYWVTSVFGINVAQGRGLRPIRDILVHLNCSVLQLC